MAITSEDIGIAVLVFGACFIGAYVASRRQPPRDRLRSALFWGSLFGAGQLARAAFDIHFEPPVSTILTIATVVIILAGVVLLLRDLVFDGGN